MSQKQIESAVLHEGNTCRELDSRLVAHLYMCCIAGSLLASLHTSAAVVRQGG